MPQTNASSNNSSTNTTHTNNSNNNNTNTNSNNINSNNTNTIHQINYFVNFSREQMTDHFYSKFGAKYINRGEEGLYDFFYWEVFTDPSNPNNTAIKCTNHKNHRFIYGMLNSDGTTEIVEDISLKKFNEYLSRYNKVIIDIIDEFHPRSIGCLGYTNEEANKKVQTLIKSMIERKNMSSYMAKKCRTTNSLASDEDEIDDEYIRKKREFFKDNNMHVAQKHVMSDEEKMDIAAYNIREAQRNPRKEYYQKMVHKTKDTITCWNEEKQCVEIKDEKEEFQKCVDEDNRKIQKDLAKAEEARNKEEEKKRAREERERIRLETERFKRNEAIEKKKRLMERKKEREEQEKKDDEEEKKLAKMIDPNRPDSDDEEEKVIPKSKVKRERKYVTKSDKIVKKVEKRSGYKIKPLDKSIETIEETSEEDETQ